MRPPWRTFGSPVVWAVLAALLSALAVVAWWTPSARAEMLERPVSVHFHLDYRAARPASDPVYGVDGVRFGDPVFLALAPQVEFTARLAPLADAVPAREVRLDLAVVLASSAGWRRELARTEPFELGRNGGTARLTVDFAGALDIAAGIDAVTGVPGSLTVAVSARAELVPDAPGAGLPDDGLATTDLAFELTDRMARPAVESPPGETGPVVASRTVTWMRPEPVERPVAVSLGPLHAGLGGVRMVLGTAALVTLAVAAHSVFVALRSRRDGEGRWLLARHGGRLLVAGEEFVPPTAVVDLGSFAALAAVGADTQQRVMVHVDDADGQVTFYVIDGGTAFRYRAREPMGA